MDLQSILNKYPPVRKKYTTKILVIYVLFAVLFVLGAVLCSKISGNSQNALIIYIFVSFGLIILYSVLQARVNKKRSKKYALALSELIKKEKSPKRRFRALMQMEQTPPTEDMRALWRISVSEALCDMGEYDLAISCMQALAAEMDSKASRPASIRLKKEVEEYCTRVEQEKLRKEENVRNSRTK